MGVAYSAPPPPLASGHVLHVFDLIPTVRAYALWSIFAYIGAICGIASIVTGVAGLQARNDDVVVSGRLNAALIVCTLIRKRQQLP